MIAQSGVSDRVLSADFTCSCAFKEKSIKRSWKYFGMTYAHERFPNAVEAQQDNYIVWYSLIFWYREKTINMEIYRQVFLSESVQDIPKKYRVLALNK